MSHPLDPDEPETEIQPVVETKRDADTSPSSTSSAANFLDDLQQNKTPVKLDHDFEIDPDFKRNRGAGDHGINNMPLAFSASWGGICFAGSLYPTVVGTVWMVIVLVYEASRGGVSASNSDFVLGFLCGTAGVILIGGLIGGLLATFSALVVFLLLMLLEWSLARPFHPRTAVILCGGLSGYFATYWITVPMLYDPRAIPFLFWLPPLAMLMGHIGALKAANGTDRRRYGSWHRDQAPFQFQIRQIMITTAWVAGVFAIERLGNNFIFTGWILIGACLQLMMLLADRWWVHWHWTRFSKP